MPKTKPAPGGDHPHAGQTVVESPSCNPYGFARSFCCCFPSFLGIEQDQDKASFLNELAARIATELAFAGQDGQPVRKQRGDFFVEEVLKIFIADLGAVRLVGTEEKLGADERLCGDFF